MRCAVLANRPALRIGDGHFANRQRHLRVGLGLQHQFVHARLQRNSPCHGNVIDRQLRALQPRRQDMRVHLAVVSGRTIKHIIFLRDKPLKHKIATLPQLKLHFLASALRRDGLRAEIRPAHQPSRYIVLPRHAEHISAGEKFGESGDTQPGNFLYKDKFAVVLRRVHTALRGGLQATDLL